MNFYIGIDPSINSTGLTILKYDDQNLLIDEYFFIIKPDKLTRNEKNISIENFQYIIYKKEKYKDLDNHLSEYYKTLNMINIAENIINIIKTYTTKEDNIYISMEGISYGSSLKTKSIYDLSGLNYLIRYLIIKNEHMKLIICPPSEIKKFASGLGNANKDILISSFVMLYPSFKVISKLDDLVDSYYMAKYAYMNKQ